MAASATSVPAAASSAIASAVSILTVTVKPLTTTFTPPASCGEMQLTQLSSPGYQIWLNEPQPVYNASSSIAPVFSPLVCPEGWTTAGTWTSGYIACCTSGFQLHLPDTTVDGDRPAYGGTCYSNFQSGQTVKVTAYDSASVTRALDWTASASTDQAYAHPIDGFQITSTNDSHSAKLSGGAIAGIVVGSVVGLIAILMALLFLLRRYRQKKNQPPSLQPQIQEEYRQEWNKDILVSPETDNSRSPYDSSSGIYGSGTPSYKINERYELDGHQPRELDSGWIGRELEVPPVHRHEEGRSRKQVGRESVIIENI
ncbi:uncharacterized protein F4822DRAFT_423731 [Hypoxylon trugodes]|uniref:uncharacterized protein n=1 Tax=Hypoxylon trugodes TaxID=326681 RepID=UPI00219D1455|nr:uncharacterized protein F4822DRAFT_423731 [Hypoxylon trugodes]KAI1393263.1 hypothetical protein F4822DRAFT_423731 [Hypoxylon trugodes]